jgi:DNA repair exonuclease SbcCD ATPase subunit
MIQFQLIKWKNFLSTGNVFTEIKLNDSGTTLIIGENGSGKSTMLDALTFALFGKPFRDIKKNQMVNSITRKDTVIELDFYIQPNQYKIIRGIKPNIFELYCNGDLVNQTADIKDYQEQLEKQILKFNFKTFCQVVVLGSASFVPFMQLPSGQRRAVIEDILDLQIFTTMNTILKDKIKINDEDVKQSINDKRLIETKIELVMEHLKDLETQNKNLIEEKELQINSSEKQIKKADITKNNIREEAEIIKNSLPDKSSVVDKVDSYKNLRSQLLGKIKTVTEDIKFLNNYDNCPVCKQAIDARFKCESTTDKNKLLEELNDGVDKLNNKIETQNKKLQHINEIETKLSEFRNKWISADTLYKSLINQHNILLNDLKKLNAKKESKSDVKIADLEQNLTDVSAHYNDLQEEKKVLSAAGLLLKDGGIKTKIINQYMPVINKLINKYLSMLDFFVQFEINGQFEETIKSRYRDEFSYASFSEGEKQKIDLALLFVWRAVAKLRNSLATNILILDEVFDSSLDQSATENLMTILNILSKDTSLIVISHKENMNERFNNVITFEKVKNFSKIKGIS